MTKVCFICQKSIVTGGNRKHRRGSSGGGGAWRFKSQRTLRTWKPNLRKITIDEGGIVYREVICMKCYKRLRNEEPAQVVHIEKPAPKMQAPKATAEQPQKIEMKKQAKAEVKPEAKKSEKAVKSKVKTKAKSKAKPAAKAKTKGKTKATKARKASK